MARELGEQIPTFKEAEHMLGCTGHVFNLAAEVGLRALGHKSKEAAVVHLVSPVE